MIRALWDLSRSCFARLNAPQRVRILERLAGRHAGSVLQRDLELLSTILYGDDMAISQGDPLLNGLANAATGSQITGISLNSSLRRIDFFDSYAPVDL